MSNQRWSLETIKQGIDRFIVEWGRPPTGTDFDATGYLPSARQIQRLYGGLPRLRAELGYKDLDFTKGGLRKGIAIRAFSDGLQAEERLEQILVEKFGEPYVHTQKRYAFGAKRRFDFFVYAKNHCFGVDVFTITRAEYIRTNIRHKVGRYKSAISTPVILVALDEGGLVTTEELRKAVSSVKSFTSYAHMSAMNEEEFLQYIRTLESFTLPEDFKGIEYIEQK